MFKQKPKLKFILPIIALFGVFFIASFVFAQIDPGLEFGAGTGLGTQDIRITIASIIRTGLGILGIIAVVVIIAGGIVYMTAGGDSNKTNIAKKIIINGAIGLAIILLSFAIAQFVLNSLIESTTGRPSEVSEPSGGSGGGFGSGAFTLRGITPTGVISIRNVAVRATFNSGVNNATVEENFNVIRVSDGSDVEGTFITARNTIEFIPVQNCPVPNEDRKCFDSDAEYRVNLTEDIQNLSGLSLVCGGFAPACDTVFTTGSLVDVANPSISITAPENGESISENSFALLQAEAEDDAGISQIEFYIDGVFENADAPLGETPLSYTGSVEWDTAGVILGRHSVSARAYDIDSNNQLSREINFYVRAEHCFNGIIDGDEVNVDCGGSDCAVCEGGACAEDGDCASGVCRENICIEVPRIDAISPGDGREGNYITVVGNFFGDSEGQVMFLGQIGDNDNQIASLASCDGAWSNNQIIVEVPTDAMDGPIQIVSATDAIDRTDDARGPLIADFDVNEVARPGLCSLAPQSGIPTDAIEFIGTGFSESQGGNNALLGGRDILSSSWANESIAGTVPNIATGRQFAQVLVGDEASNPVYFTVSSSEAGTIPSVTCIDPSFGPRENIITIFGENFGRNTGLVIFTNETTGDNATALINFPAMCGDSFWNNDSIIVKVPIMYASGLEIVDGIHSVKVQRTDGIQSAPIEFSIEAGVAGPGICKIDPNNGPVNSNITIYGEKFSDNRGTAIFWNAVNAKISGWDDEQILSSAPDGAETGPVSVATNGQISNRVNFRVANCNEVGCDEGEQCCGNGICISEDETCEVGPRQGGFFWQFSTGIIPTVPRVVEECGDGVSPSPSPWDKRRGGNDVCVNVAINVRFTESIDPVTLNPDTIQVYRCVSEDIENPCAEGEIVDGNIRIGDDSFSFTPLGNLSFLPASIYYVNLTAGIRGVGAYSEFLTEDAKSCGIGNAYCFSFKTRVDENPCEIGNVVVDPSNAIIDKQGGTKEYKSSAISRDDICIVLDPDVYNWDWNSSDNTKANITNNDLGDGRVDATQTATALSETSPNIPVKITAQIQDENISDYGNLSINFIDPKVVDKWPNCAEACVNSEIGVQFNTSMNEESITRLGNIMVYKCANESCRRFSGELGGVAEYNLEEKKVFFRYELLDEATYYRVILRGGARGVSSASGVPLTQTNYGEDDQDYSWIFRTKNSDEPCAVVKVEIKPPEATLSYIGQIQEYNTTAFGAEDECSLQGQRLQTTNYDWSWSSSELSVADFVQFNGDLLNVLPRFGNNGCSDQCLNTGTQSGLSVCGNGVLENGEDCDDGNIISNDGCSTQCINEGSNLTCGNGVLENGEDCDDGNMTNNDGCSDICLNEGSDFGNSVCGNNDIGDGEDCDDGNRRSGDGCSNICLNEGSITGPMPVCGNGILENGEDCDDGNLSVGDGCDSICLNEGTLQCVGGVGVGCCGNGILENGEDCDGGGDGCSLQCLLEGSNVKNGSICGNGILENGEECEFGGALDLNTDPIQYTQAVGGGISTISAGTNGIFDDGTLEVLCVCSNDSSCSYGSTFPGELGCGLDGCCESRARLISFNPLSGSSQICRNTVISAEFDQLMDVESFENNFELVFARDGDCPKGSKILNTRYCEVSGDISHRDINGKTTFNFIPETPLNPNLRHFVTIYFDTNLTDNNQTGVKNRNGVPAISLISSMAGNSIRNQKWSFTTGSEICVLDEVEVNPEILYFLQVDAQDIYANGYSRTGGLRQEIIPIPDVYDWEWKWRVRNASLVNLTESKTNLEIVSIPLESAQKGATSILATATIIADSSRVPTTGRELVDEGKIIVMICENPWPARKADGSWSPYQESGDGNNFSFYYCRDANRERDKTDDLPSIANPVSVPAPPLPNILSEFIIPVNCPADSATCGRGDGMGIRVMMNQDHHSPKKWYSLNGFTGVPAEIMIDGYSAIQDGRTVYVNAANESGQRIYTNIYILSYTETAGMDTINVFDQILENISFTTTIDSEIEKDQIRRDVARLADVRNMEEALTRYGQLSRKCSATQNTTCFTDSDCPLGEECSYVYPKISAGSFFSGYSNSAWSSWQSAFGNELGFSLPQDPLNKFNVSIEKINSAGACIASYSSEECLKANGCSSPYDNESCYSSDEQTFNCPINSYIYEYENCSGNNYNLSFGLEFKGAFWIMDKLFDLPYNLTLNYCDGKIFNNSNICSSERGEAGIMETTTGCGNGILEVDLFEYCDDGSLNGTYNHCNMSCSGWGAYCGDGDVQYPPFGAEVCDLGSNNGIYNSECSWDCSGSGSYCGDGEIQAEEACELGDRETTKEAVDTLPACVISPEGYQTQRTKVCNVTCDGWQAWGACLQVGSCGNGLVDSDQEQCDDGNTKNDDSCSNECQNAFCGDGYVRTNYEQCDLGKDLNGKVCIPGKGLICSYCSDRCVLLTVSD